MPMRVLIAEDEPRLAEALARGLRRNGFAVDIALDGEQALKRTSVVDYAADVHARVEGLNLGADDYLTKPFAFAEVVARLHALQRRHAVVQKPVLERSGVRLDPARHEVTRDGRPVTLSPKEFGVLHVLLRADGTVVSPETLLERVWDEHVDPFTNTVRVTVMNLRRKLGAPAVIETVIGTGYRLA